MRLKKQTVKNLYGYAMLFPAYSIYFLFVLIPAAVTIYLSFTNYDLSSRPDFIGLENFIRLFQDELFLKSMWNTVVYTVFSLFPPMIIGLIIAVLLNKKIPGRSFFRTSFYLPYIPSMIAMGMVWLWLFDASNGLFNAILGGLNLPQQNWLTDPELALGSVILMSIWKAIGYNMIIYLGGLQEIPEYLYEAAKIDGASPIRTFFTITVPMLQPVTFFLFVTGLINCFNVFDQVKVMTDGGPLDSTTTVVHQMYIRGFFFFEMGYASSMIVILLFIVFTLTMLNFKYGNQGHDRGSA